MKSPPIAHAHATVPAIGITSTRCRARSHGSSGSSHTSPTARAHAVWVGEDVFTLAVSVVTLGIYTPRKVAVTCEKVP